MRSKPSLIGLSVLVFLAASCGTKEDPSTGGEAGAGSPAGNTIGAGEHTSRNSLDWAGTYSGILPCADCPGIETLITLRENGSFVRTMIYLERSVAPVVDSGSFAWQENGNIIELATDGDGSNQYQVGENQLFALDGDGHRITGDIAPEFVLAKHVNDPAIEGRKWMLVELHGKPVDSTSNAFFSLDPNESRASGNTSCNSFSGSYAIKNGQRISFAGNMVMTLRACMDMSIEKGFIEVLEIADNYSVGNDDTMTLNKARMAPLARFRVVEGG